MIPLRITVRGPEADLTDDETLLWLQTAVDGYTGGLADPPQPLFWHAVALELWRCRGLPGVSYRCPHDALGAVTWDLHDAHDPLLDPDGPIDQEKAARLKAALDALPVSES